MKHNNAKCLQFRQCFFSVKLQPHAKGYWGRVIGILFVLCAAAAPAWSRQVEKSAAVSSLDKADMAVIGDLFGKLREAFIAGDAQACSQLFTPASQKQPWMLNLKSEFEQFQYLDFEILQISPDDSLQNNIHSVEVRFRARLREKNASSLVSQIENSSIHTFLIEKLEKGSFALVQSSFFENLGLRKGMNLVLDALLAVIAFCVLLAFWVWMGWEAWRARPRRLLWRTLVFVPLAGACVFFLCVYLPRQFRGHG